MALYHMWAIAFGSPEAILLPRHASAVRDGAGLPALPLPLAKTGDDGARRHRGAARCRTARSTHADRARLRAAAVGIAPILYLFVNYDYIVNRIFYVDDLTPTDMIMGAIMTVMVLEATRRVIGWALPITAIVFLVYGLFIARLEPMRMLDQLYMTTEGIFGIPLVGVGVLRADLRAVRLVHGAHRHRPAVHGFRHGLTGHTAGGPARCRW